MKNIYTIVLLIIVAGGALYLNFSNKRSDSVEKGREIQENSEDQETEEENIIEPESSKYIYFEEAVIPDKSYFEKYPIIDGQQAYIAYPIEIDLESPPLLVVYHHGSNTTVTQNHEDPFMKDLKMYGEYFATRGIAFGASNQHGMNYGNQASIDDVTKLIQWVKDNYKIRERVSMLGFSMGGLPAIYFATQNTDKVHSLALLAPVTYIWGSSIYRPLEGIPIKIWHGTRDVNVGYSASTGFIDRGKPYNLSVELRTVEGAGHFDIDTEYVEEIHQFILSVDRVDNDE